MNTKQKAADVLAVMDRSAEVMCDEAAPIVADVDVATDLRDGADELVEARAAVAELIEAATAARDHVRPTCTELFERLDASIARCKGE